MGDIKVLYLERNECGDQFVPKRLEKFYFLQFDRLPPLIREKRSFSKVDPSKIFKILIETLINEIKSVLTKKSVLISIWIVFYGFSEFLEFPDSVSTTKSMILHSKTFFTNVMFCSEILREESNLLLQRKMNMENENVEVIEFNFTISVCQDSNKKNQIENFSKAYSVKVWSLQIRPIWKKLGLW